MSLRVVASSGGDQREEVGEMVVGVEEPPSSVDCPLFASSCPESSVSSSDDFSCSCAPDAHTCGRNREDPVRKVSGLLMSLRRKILHIAFRNYFKLSVPRSSEEDRSQYTGEKGRTCVRLHYHGACCEGPDTETGYDTCGSPKTWVGRVAPARKKTEPEISLYNCSLTSLSVTPRTSTPTVPSRRCLYNEKAPRYQAATKET